MPFFVDTHCHLDAAEFAADRDTVRAQAAAVGVAHCVIPAVERANWDAVRQLAHRHGDSYALGIHPLYTARAADADLALLAQALEQHPPISLPHMASQLTDRLHTCSSESAICAQML